MLFVLTDIFFSSLHGMQESGEKKMFFIKVYLHLLLLIVKPVGKTSCFIIPFTKLCQVFKSYF